MNSKKLKSNLLLLLTAMIWGTAFVAQDLAAQSNVGALIFNSIRSLVAGIALLPVVYFMSRSAKKRGETAPDSTPKGKRDLLIGGICCGTALTVAAAFQQAGIAYTTPGKAGFITALYIILVPIAGIFMKKKVHFAVWIGAVLGVIGLYFLCITEGFKLQYGDFLILICSFGYTVHILVIDHFSPRVDGVKMSCIQFFVSAVLSFAGSFILGEGPISQLHLFVEPNVIIAYVYTGVMSSGVGYTLQITSQKNTSAAMASIIMSLESVFAVLAGWVLLSQALSLREFLGCVLMFAAILLAQFPDIFSKKTPAAKA